MHSEPVQERSTAVVEPVAHHSGPASSGGIDKSVLTLSEVRRYRDKGHVKFVASRPCLVCGRKPVDPHHLRFAQVRALGRKVSDEFTVPLCRSHHRELHLFGNERGWWKGVGIDPLKIARALWKKTRLPSPRKRPNSRVSDRGCPQLNWGRSAPAGFDVRGSIG